MPPPEKTDGAEYAPNDIPETARPLRAYIPYSGGEGKGKSLFASAPAAVKNTQDESAAKKTAKAPETQFIIAKATMRDEKAALGAILRTARLNGKTALGEALLGARELQLIDGVLSLSFEDDEASELLSEGENAKLVSKTLEQFGAVLHIGRRLSRAEEQRKIIDALNYLGGGRLQVV